MEKAIRIQRIPQTDSIEELARFWDTHDLTDFEDQLNEVTEPIFLRRKPTAVTIRLTPREVKALKRIAKSQGVDDTALLRQWILERLHRSPSAPPNKGIQPTAQRTRRG